MRFKIFKLKGQISGCDHLSIHDERYVLQIGYLYCAKYALKGPIDFKKERSSLKNNYADFEKHASIIIH